MVEVSGIPILQEMTGVVETGISFLFLSITPPSKETQHLVEWTPDPKLGLTTLKG